MKSAIRSIIYSISIALINTGGLVIAEETPLSNEVSVRNIAYRGAGCRQGSVNYTLSPDAKAFTVLFDNYSISAGGEEAEIIQKSCVVDVQLNFPPGWSYAVLGVDYRGFANLDAGAQATQMSCYSFVSNPSIHYLGEQKLQGPYSTSYFFHNDIPVQNQGWSSCEATTDTLRIKTSVRVDGDFDHTAMMTVDSLDGDLKHKYQLLWRRCPGQGGAELVNVYQFSVGGQRQFYYTSDLNEASGRGLQNPQLVFKVYKNQVGVPAGAVALYKCVAGVFGERMNFLSLSQTCDINPARGNTFNIRQTGILGYIINSVLPSHVPLYRFASDQRQLPPNGGDGETQIIKALKGGMMFGINPEEAIIKAGLRGKQVLGYVPSVVGP